MKKFFFFISLVFISLVLNGFASEQSSSKKSSSAGHGAVHWGYTGHEGPESWGNLSQDYALCETGKNQSPINILGGVETKLDQIEFNYSSTSVNFINTGHTLQMNYSPEASFLERDLSEVPADGPTPRQL